MTTGVPSGICGGEDALFLGKATVGRGWMSCHRPRCLLGVLWVGSAEGLWPTTAGAPHRCLVEGPGEVAFVKHTTVTEAMDGEPFHGGKNSLIRVGLPSRPASPPPCFWPKKDQIEWVCFPVTS